MKTCPRCQQTFDDSLNFCLNDGTALPPSVPDHLAQTVAMGAPRATAGQQAAQPPAWNISGGPPAGKGKGSSKALVWVLGILGSLALVCGGAIAGLVYLGSRTIDGVESNRPSANLSNLKIDTNFNIQMPSRKGEYELSMAKFSQLKVGMERSEVERILGGKGTEISSSSGGGMRFSVNKWEGDNFESIILSFRNDKIMTKSQVGLDK